MFKKGDIVVLKEKDEAYNIDTDRQFEVESSDDEYTTTKVLGLVVDDNHPQMYYTTKTTHFGLYEVR
jgi:hypothetical protein